MRAMRNQLVHVYFSVDTHFNLYRAASASERGALPFFHSVLFACHDPLPYGRGSEGDPHFAAVLQE
jgi:hypothetical protein